MRTRYLSALPAAMLAVAALPAPAFAAAGPADSALALARNILRTAEPSIAGVCDAVNQASATLDRLVAARVTCTTEALTIVREIDEALPEPTPVAPNYVVVLKDQPPVAAGSFSLSSSPSLSGTPDGAAFAAWQQGAAVEHVYRHALRGYSATMSAATLASVQNDPAVAYVEEDDAYSWSVRQPNPPWGLDRIDQRALPLDNSYYYNQTGAGVTAYVIDSGINYGHTDFGGRAVFGADTSNTPGGGGADCIGHGTHVAGTIGGNTHGVAKGVSLVSVRVGDCNTLEESDIIAGIDYVTNVHQPGQRAVANLSLGGPPSAALDTAVVNSINDGIVYSIAAGNSATDACNVSPARVPAAMTIGASDIGDQRTWFSNYGACVDWFAPGDNITSAWIGSPTATNTIDGTSMAAPHNTGVAALYLEANPTATTPQVTSAISQWTTKNVIGNANGSPAHLLHVATPLHIAVGGTIEITRTTGSPTFTTTGVFNTSEYTCGWSTSAPVEVLCTANPNPDIVWECVHFVLTAQGLSANAAVSGHVTCDSGQTTSTGDATGTTASGGDNFVTGEQLGSAYTVRCRAGGTGGGTTPAGAYKVTCNEPGAAYPFSR